MDRLVPTAVEIVVILPMLERARDALDHDQPTAGRAYVDDAIRRLEAAKAAQDRILDEWADHREAPGGRAVVLDGWRGAPRPGRRSLDVGAR
jgi:hypothetical protein